MILASSTKVDPRNIPYHIRNIIVDDTQGFISPQPTAMLRCYPKSPWGLNRKAQHYLYSFSSRVLNEQHR